MTCGFQGRLQGVTEREVAALHWRVSRESWAAPQVLTLACLLHWQQLWTVDDLVTASRPKTAKVQPS